MALKEVDSEFLIQITDSIEEAVNVLKEASIKKDADKFFKAKRLIIELQDKLEGEVANA